MSDVIYNVELRLGTSGGFSAGIDAVNGKAGQIDKIFESIGDKAAGIGEKLGAALSGAVDHVVDLSMHFAKIGAVGAIGIATYGVAHLNNELEQTQIALGAIANARGYAKTFDEGFQLAGDQVAKMKQDVKTLPGDLGQLSNIMKMIATPAAQGGASLDAIRQLAGRTMLTGQILGVQQDVAAREMAGLLAGRAGSHNILGGRLGLIGDEAKAFNHLDPSARLARINKELDKYQGAADRFGTSFVANWTTLKDNVKYGFIAEATQPLFERVKDEIAHINGYIDTHKAKVEEVAHTVGLRLVGAWDAVLSGIRAIEPYVARIGDRLLSMSGAEIFQKLEHAGETLLGTKLAGLGISGASQLLPLLLRAGALGGGGGGAGLALAAPVAGLAAGAAAIGGVGLVGAIHDLTDSTSSYHQEAVEAAKDIGETMAHLGETVSPALDALKGFANYLGLGLLQDLRAGAHLMDAAADAGKDVGNWFANLPRMFESWDDQLARAKFNESVDKPGGIADHAAVMPHLVQLARNEFRKSENRASPSAGGGGGGGGAHFSGPITITVSSNQDPSMIARLTAAKLAELSRFSRSSRYATNFSGTRGHGG